MLGVKSHHVACEAGVEVPMFAGLPSSGLRTVRGVGATCKGSIPHLEKPKVRI